MSYHLSLLDHQKHVVQEENPDVTLSGSLITNLINSLLYKELDISLISIMFGGWEGDSLNITLENHYTL